MSEKQPKGKLIGYWVLTLLFLLPMAAGGVSDILHVEAVVETFALLQYPLYLATIIGIAKLLGTVALLAPKFPRLKEWAYAGFAIDLTGAAASHAFVADYAGIAPPLILLGIMFGSYFLRPPSRRL